MPRNCRAVASDGGSGLDGAGGIAVEVVSGLADDRKEDRKIDLFLFAIPGGQGVKIIGKIVCKDGRKMEFEPGGIVSGLDPGRQGSCKGFQLDRKSVV